MPIRLILLTLLLSAAALAAPNQQLENGRAEATLSATRNYHLILLPNSPRRPGDFATIAVLGSHGISISSLYYLTWPGIEDYCRGYTEASKPAIERKYGADVWKRLELEIRDTIKPEFLTEDAPIYRQIRTWSQQPIPPDTSSAALPIIPHNSALEQYHQGRFAATSTVARGTYYIQIYEMGDVGVDWPVRKLLEAHNIKASGPGCLRWSNQADYFRGWNDITKPAIEAKYGKTIWKRLTAEGKAALKKEGWKGSTPILDLVGKWGNSP